MTNPLDRPVRVPQEGWADDCAVRPADVVAAHNARTEDPRDLLLRWGVIEQEHQELRRERDEARAEVQRWRDTAHRLSDSVDRLSEDRERLREALHEQCNPNCTQCYVWRNEQRREALGEKP